MSVARENVKTEDDEAIEVPTFPQLREDPLAPPSTYEQWREETPAKEVLLQNGKRAWVVTRQEHVREAFGDPTLSRDPSSDDFPQVRRGMSFRRNDLITHHMDPPLHSKLRKILAPLFTAKRVNEKREEIQSIVEESVDRLLTLPQPLDFHKEFSLRIPSIVICRILGIDYSYHEQFEKHATVITRASSSQEDFAAARQGLMDVSNELVEQAMENPGGGVLEAMINKLKEGAMTREQVVANTYHLVLGGHETTAHTISLGVLQLQRDPEIRQLLTDNPDRIPDAITEMLRLQSINDGSTARLTTREMDVGGVKIPAGVGLIPVMSPAHRDPRHWENPDKFDIDRDNSEHVALGGAGIHACLGQNLARMELEIVFETLLRRLPDLRWADSEDDIKFQWDGFVFGVESMPVKL